MAATKELLQSVRALEGDGVYTEQPPNSFTAEEYMAEFGLHDTQARKRLSALVQQGKLKKIRFRVPDKGMGTQSVAYLLVGEEK